MSRQLFTNNAVTLLAAPLSPLDTDLQVMTGYGGLFPQPTLPGDYFVVTLENQAATLREIIHVTGRVGDTFTGILRGQEGTPILSWGASSGDDTLVDHRVTAATMRRAMELPTLAISDLTDVNVTTPAVGEVLTWNGTQWISQPAGMASTWINGGNSGPTIVPTTTPVVIDDVTYSATNRSFKLLVTLTNTLTEATHTFESLVSISGRLSMNTETVSWNRYGMVGSRLGGQFNITLDPTTKTMSVWWSNSETSPVVATVTRIQQAL